jgi:hypothetical protein
MPIKREWIDPRLMRTVALKHCTTCNQDDTMLYQKSFERTSGEQRDIYKSIADCKAKWEYQVNNPDLKFVHPLLSYPKEIKK